MSKKKGHTKSSLESLDRTIRVLEAHAVKSVVAGELINDTGAKRYHRIESLELRLEIDLEAEVEVRDPWVKLMISAGGAICHDSGDDGIDVALAVQSPRALHTMAAALLALAEHPIGARMLASIKRRKWNDREDE